MIEVFIASFLFAKIKIMKTKETNVHHKFPKWQGWLNHPDNLIRMNIYKHRALHLLTDINWKATNPKQQIEILLWIVATCLTDEVKNDFKKILEIKEPEYFFKNWIYKRK